MNVEISRKLALAFNEYPLDMQTMFAWGMESIGVDSVKELSKDLRSYLDDPKHYVSSLTKHLAGRHDQSTHGHGASHTHPEASSTPTKRIYKNSDWSQLKGLPSGNPELDKIAGNYIGSSDNINEVLRTGSLKNYGVTTITEHPKEVVDKYREQARILEEGVRSVEVSEDMMVQRGVEWDTFGVEHEYGNPKDENDAKALIGTTYADKGFVSCSTMLDNGKPVPMTQFQKRSVQLRISVPKGTKGVALNQWEKEFLFPPNTAILITDVKVNVPQSIIEAVVVQQ